MKIFVSAYFARKYNKIVKKNPDLSSSIDKKLKIFEQNPNYPSLRLHKLSGTIIEEWSISVKGNLRIIFQYVPEGILVTDIGTHDEVY